MQWEDVLADKSLQDLPYKIELNEYGQITMAPATNKHAFLQSEIAYLLRSQLTGRTLTESPVQTTKGTRVPDVTWCSDAFFKQHGFETPYTRAPEICVEVVSPSNSKKEMDEKKQLYLSQGAIEIWFVDDNGRITVFDQDGQRQASQFGVTCNKIALPKF